MTSGGRRRDGARRSAWGLARGGRRAAALGTLLGVALALGTMPGASADPCGGFEAPCSQETAQQFGYGSVQRQDTPNDPDYDQAEPDTQQPPANRSSNFYAERFDLFGFPSQLTPTRSTRPARTRANRWSPASTPPAPGRPSAAAPTPSSRSSTTASTGASAGCATRSTSTPASCPTPSTPTAPRAAPTTATATASSTSRTTRTTRASPVLPRAQRAGRADHRPGPDPRVRQLPDRRRPPARAVQRRASTSTTTATASPTTSPAGTSSTTTTNRPTSPATSPRTTTAPAARVDAVEQGNDGAGLDRRLPALPGHADPDLGHVRLRRATTSRSGSSTRPTTAPG